MQNGGLSEDDYKKIYLRCYGVISNIRRQKAINDFRRIPDYPSTLLPL